SSSSKSNAGARHAAPSRPRQPPNPRAPRRSPTRDGSTTTPLRPPHHKLPVRQRSSPLHLTAISRSHPPAKLEPALHEEEPPDARGISRRRQACRTARGTLTPPPAPAGPRHHHRPGLSPLGP